MPYFNPFYLLLDIGKLKIYFQYVWFDSCVSSHTKAEEFICFITASLCGAACLQTRRESSPASVRDGIAKLEEKNLDVFIS